MARVDVPGGDGLEAKRIWQLAPHLGAAMGAMGEAGVTKALEIIHKELDLTMAFCGRTDIDSVDKSILVPGTF